MPDTDTVAISVIIPVYNDPEGLETTVESLLDQTADNYEIIIADNGSTDLTRRLAKAYATRDRVRRVVEDEIQGSYAARNAGIDVTQGDLLCFVDADMWVDDDWVARVREHIQRTGVDYFGCNVEIVVERETLCAEYNRHSGFPVERYITEKQFAPTCCLVVRAAVLDDVGTFDGRLVSSGDLEFGKRVHRAGYTQGYAGDITMYHPARESLAALLKKRHRIGRGTVQCSRYHPELFPDTRHPLHPFNFLPARPGTVPEQFKNESLGTHLSVYFVLYLLKLASTLGQTTEWVNQAQTA